MIQEGSAGMQQGESQELVRTLSLDEAGRTIEQSLVDIGHSLLAHVPQLAAGAVVLAAVGLITWAFRNLLERLLRRTKLRRSLRELVIRLAFIALWMLGLLFAAMIVFPGLTPAKALGGLGVASVAIGFAFKDIFENFFAGVLILWRFPFDNGDYIECGDLMGQVEEITIRNTLIRRPTGELVIVPNSRLFTQPADVLTDRTKRRTSLVCGIGYGEKVQDAIRILRSAVSRCKTITTDTQVEVLAKEFGASGVDIEITWWTRPEPGQIRRSIHEVIKTTKEALDAAGIEIPFPYRTLVFKEPLSLLRHGEGAPEDAQANHRLPG